MSRTRIFSQLGTLVLGLAGGILIASVPQLLARDAQPQSTDEVVAAAGTNSYAYIVTREGLVYRVPGRGADPIELVGSLFASTGLPQVPPVQRQQPPAQELPVRQQQQPVSPQQPGQPPVPTTGVVLMRFEPIANVFVDGVHLGELRVLQDTLSVGQHSLRLTRPGFRPYEETFIVVGGETLRLTVRLVRLP